VNTAFNYLDFTIQQKDYKGKHEPFFKKQSRNRSGIRFDGQYLMHPLLVPGTPIDLALLSDVASSVDNLSVDEQTRSSANSLLVQFSERPDVFLHVDSVVNSDCPPIAKFAVLLSLERVARDCWLGLEPDDQAGLKSCLLGCLTNADIGDDLLTKVIDILIHILRCEYPDMWPTFLAETIEQCHGSLFQCRRSFRLLADFVEVSLSDRDNPFCSVGARRIGGGISQHFDEVSELMVMIIRESSDVHLAKQVIATLSRLIRWVSGPEFFESELFSDICESLSTRPELALEAIPVLTESFTFFYIPRDSRGSVTSFFVLVAQALDPLFGPDCSGAAHLGRHEFFVASFMNGMTCLVAHYFDFIFGTDETTPVFLRTVQFALALTQATNDEAFELYCNRFWSVLFERDELTAALDEFCPVVLEIYLRKMPSPFVKVRWTNADTGEDEFQIVDQLPARKPFPIRRIAERDRAASLALMGSILDECVTSSNFEGICRVCYSLGGFVSAELSQENCQLVADLLRTLFGLCGGIDDAEGRSTVAIGIGVVLADLAPLLVCSLPLLRAALRQLFDFLVSEQRLLQEATLIALIKVLRFVATDQKRLGRDAVSEIFNDLFERMPQMLDRLSDRIVREFFVKLQGRAFNQFTVRSERLLVIASERIDHLLAELPTNLAIAEQLGTYFLAFASSCIMNWRQAAALLQGLLPRYFECFQFLSQAIRECQDQEALRECKDILTDLFANAAASPVDDLISTDLLPLFMNDFEASDARCPAMFSLLANSLKLEFWDQPDVLQELFQKVIFPVETMLQSEFDFNIAFYLPFGELLLQLLVKKLNVLEACEGNPIQYIFEQLIQLASIACDGRDVLVSRIASTFELIRYIHGQQMVDGLLENYAIPLIETFFQIVFHYTPKTDIYGVSNAIQSILAHPYMKKNWKSVCDLVFKLVPNCDPDEAMLLITQAYEPMDGLLFLETLKMLMLDLRYLTPGQSVDMFSETKAQAIGALAEVYDQPPRPDMLDIDDTSELQAIPTQLLRFSVLGK
jgi:hypothetical protein